MGRNWDSKRWLKYINYRKKYPPQLKTINEIIKREWTRTHTNKKKFIVIHKHVVLTPSVILSNVTLLNIFLIECEF